LGKNFFEKELGRILITIDIIINWIARVLADDLRNRQTLVIPRLIYHKMSKGGIKKA
jgi:hypothetical protein